MREIIALLLDTYSDFSGRGKLLPLFLVSLIILFLVMKKEGSRIRPLLFVLSVWTAISAAFVTFTGSIKSRKYRLGAGLFLAAMIVLSGSLIWSRGILVSAGEIRQQEEDCRTICDRILSEDPAAGVIASPGLMPYLCASSASITPLYEVPYPGKEDELGEEDHLLYEAFLSQHPDLQLVRRICREESRIFAVTDNEWMWPEHVVESGFSLLDTVGHYDIYVYAGGGHE